jgi:muconolactone delta-isomerase
MWFGTPEIDGISFISLHNSNSKIQNVDDIHLALKDLITNIPYFKHMNDDLFKSSTKIGEIHIWVDGSRSLRYVK